MKLTLRPIGALVMVVMAVMMNSAEAQGIRSVDSAALRAILSEPATPPTGASKVEVTLVEYFDYNCPVCRRVEPQLDKLVENHPGIRLIHKDWPVFGDASVYAAYCSFAAAREGKYQKAHDALIGSRRDLDSRDDVRQVLREAGFDIKQLDADIKLHQSEYAAVLTRNQGEASALGLRGTPGLIIGDQLIPGGLDYSQLEYLVARARQPH
jgi:protein-disulfide isomerase